MVKIIAEGNNGAYTMKQFLEIMAVLRSPGGCPWDIEQTHKSIRNDALEEVYEVVDAIDNGDAAALCEELGDMLLQVVFHSCIAEENGEFSFDEVVDGIAKKLVLRHPHVFGEEHIDSASAVLDRWDAIKKDEKHQQTYTETLKSVPKAFPALMRAAKVQKRAKKAGLDLGNTMTNGSLEEKLLALYAAAESDDAEGMSKAYGEVLFCMAGLQNSLKINAEEALAAATDRFIDEFERVEQNGKL